MKKYEIWYDGVHPIRDHPNTTVLTFDRKGDAKAWIIQNIGESSKRRKYKVREAL